jgi:hypothetical protein
MLRLAQDMATMQSWQHAMAAGVQLPLTCCMQAVSAFDYHASDHVAAHGQHQLHCWNHPCQ